MSSRKTAAASAPLHAGFEFRQRFGVVLRPDVGHAEIEVREPDVEQSRRGAERLYRIVHPVFLKRNLPLGNAAVRARLGLEILRELRRKRSGVGRPAAGREYSRARHRDRFEPLDAQGLPRGLECVRLVADGLIRFGERDGLGCARPAVLPLFSSAATPCDRIFSASPNRPSIIARSASPMAARDAPVAMPAICSKVARARGAIVPSPAAPWRAGNRHR